MRGYVVIDQWHSNARTWDELADPRRHRGDAAQVDRMLGWDEPELLERDPGWCLKGYVVMRVEDDGALTVVHTNYDSSD